ncbi:MAG TPA: MOSC N-terminal beta barrel domain-containing protein [Acidimicrobiales bacterium]
MSSAREVGRVAVVWRYPVKSMAAEALEAVDVSWNGLQGDRRWAFIRDGSVRNGFPWHTIRQNAAMALYRPSFTEPARPDASPVVVRTPSGADLDIADPALAAELGTGVRLIKQDRGIFDSLPLSLITVQTVAELSARVDAELEALRFRPNLVIDMAAGSPFAEDGWVGCGLRIGAMRMRVDRRDQRCKIVNLDPHTLDANPDVLRIITGERDACAGVYRSTVQPGRVAVGDAVVIDP